MRSRSIVLAILMTGAGCTQQGHSQQSKTDINAAASGRFMPPPDPFGWPLLDRKNKQVGIVTTRLSKSGVAISLDTSGLPPGEHGVHIHQLAKCQPPDFKSAGGHWNWTNKKHGHKNPEGYHAGDLGNLAVGPDGKGRSTFTVATKDWDPKAVGGWSLIIHANADDEKTDPSGNSGQRIACGIFFLRRD